MCENDHPWETLSLDYLQAEFGALFEVEACPTKTADQMNGPPADQFIRRRQSPSLSSSSYDFTECELRPHVSDHEYPLIPDIQWPQTWGPETFSPVQQLLDSVIDSSVPPTWPQETVFDPESLQQLLEPGSYSNFLPTRSQETLFYSEPVQQLMDPVTVPNFLPTRLQETLGYAEPFRPLLDHSIYPIFSRARTNDHGRQPTRPARSGARAASKAADCEIGLSSPQGEYPEALSSFAREPTPSPHLNAKRKPDMSSDFDGIVRTSAPPAKRSKVIEYEPLTPPSLPARPSTYTQKSLRPRRNRDYVPRNDNTDEKSPFDADPVSRRQGGERRADQNRHAQKHKAYCFDCNKPFTRRTDLTRHLTRTKAHKGKGVICEKCENILARGDSLIRHQNTVCLSRRR
ncbi:hypothetical protein DFH06DRAFT_568745 [Mycena polygramma]|nr:hypothetical protein DFH06DRAFT_568745 [Mycena polygramma]